MASSLSTCSCEHRPSVCAELRRQYQMAANGVAARLEPSETEVFATQEDCCRPGLGAFVEGCSNAWL